MTGFLETGDQIASIASAFISLAALLVAIASLRRTRWPVAPDVEDQVAAEVTQPAGYGQELRQWVGGLTGVFWCLVPVGIFWPREWGGTLALVLTILAGSLASALAFGAAIRYRSAKKVAVAYGTLGLANTAAVTLLVEEGLPSGMQ